jgi:hypothetical protein
LKKQAQYIELLAGSVFNLDLLELELQIGGVFKVQTEKYVTN